VVKENDLRKTSRDSETITFRDYVISERITKDYFSLLVVKVEARSADDVSMKLED
jgi:hypothetical protein